MVCIFTVALLMLLPLTTVSARTFTAGTRYSSTDTLTTSEHSNLYYITAHNLQLLHYSVEIVGNGSFYFYLSYGHVDHISYRIDEHSTSENTTSLSGTYDVSSHQTSTLAGKFTIYIGSRENYNITYEIDIKVEDEKTPPWAIVTASVLVGGGALGFIGYKRWKKKKEARRMSAAQYGGYASHPYMPPQGQQQRSGARRTGDTGEFMSAAQFAQRHAQQGPGQQPHPPPQPGQTGQTGRQQAPGKPPY